MRIDEAFEGARVEVTDGMYEQLNGTVVEVSVAKAFAAVRIDSKSMNYVTWIQLGHLRLRSVIESMAEIDTSDVEDPDDVEEFVQPPIANYLGDLIE